MNDKNLYSFHFTEFEARVIAEVLRTHRWYKAKPKTQGTQRVTEKTHILEKRIWQTLALKTGNKIYLDSLL